MFEFSNNSDYEIWGGIMVFNHSFNNPLYNKIYNDMNKVVQIQFGKCFNQVIDWNKIPNNIKIIDFGIDYSQKISSLPNQYLRIFLHKSYCKNNCLPYGKISLKNNQDEIIASFF